MCHVCNTVGYVWIPDGTGKTALLNFITVNIMAETL